LSAVEALDDEGFPDVEIFNEYFSDLSDVNVAIQLSDIVNNCAKTLQAKNLTKSKKTCLITFLFCTKAGYKCVVRQTFKKHENMFKYFLRLVE
jgi:hypothetical protein